MNLSLPHCKHRRPASLRKEGATSAMIPPTTIFWMVLQSGQDCYLLTKQSPSFHLLTLLVVLLALTSGRCCQGYFNDCCSLQTVCNSIVESGHVVRKKTQTDSPQSLIFGNYYFCCEDTKKVPLYSKTGQFLRIIYRYRLLYLTLLYRLT